MVGNEIKSRNDYYPFGERACSRHRDVSWAKGNVAFAPQVQRGAISEVKTLCDSQSAFAEKEWNNHWELSDTISPLNLKRFNGKELWTEMDLNLLHFENRLLDRELNRFNTVDKLSWHPNQVDKSPYSAFWNNPFRYNDPDGNCPFCLVGFAIGFIADIAGQVIQNKLSGKNGFDKISYSTAIVSGVAGMASGGVTSITKTVAIGATESMAKQVLSDEGVKMDISLTQPVSDVG